MRRYRVEFNTQEYVYVFGNGLAEAYWNAMTYENSTRLIEDIEFSRYIGE